MRKMPMGARMYPVRIIAHRLSYQAFGLAGALASPGLSATSD
jgi:hypothetical protein